MATITNWFTLGTLGMLAGTAVLLYGYTLIPASKRKRYAILVSIPGIAIFAYAMMALGFGGIPTDGRVVWFPRYVDWFLTTPLNVLFLGLFAGADRRTIAQLVTLQALTILFGFAGALVGGLLGWVLFALGSLVFVGVVYLLYGNVATAASDTHSEVGVGLYETLRNFVVILWGIYPMIWVLGQTGVGLMDIETTALVVAYLDVVTKVGFGLLALHGEITIDELAESGSGREAVEETETDSDDVSDLGSDPDPQPSD